MSHEPTSYLGPLVDLTAARRVRAGRPIVQHLGRAKPGRPVPLAPNADDLREEAFQASLKRKEPQARWWQRLILPAALAGCAIALLGIGIHFISRAFQ